MNVAIIATNGTFLKKIAWITVTSGGVYVGLAEKFKTDHVSYHADGGYYHSDHNGKAFLIKKKAPLSQIKGYEHLLIYEGPTEILQKSFFSDFPLKRIDEGVYVDTRRLGKLWRFGVGMLEPFTFESLREFFNQAFPSIHLITHSKPWLVVGYGPSHRPVVKIERQTDRILTVDKGKGVPKI